VDFILNTRLAKKKINIKIKLIKAID